MHDESQIIDRPLEVPQNVLDMLNDIDEQEYPQAQKCHECGKLRARAFLGGKPFCYSCYTLFFD